MSEKTIALLLNAWTALGAVALMAATFILFESKISNWFLLPSFLICFGYYAYAADTARMPAIAGLSAFGFPVFEKFYQRLRTIPYLKVFFIAFCWTLLTAVFPLLLIKEWNWSFLLARFLFIIAISLFFDMVDVEEDRGKIKTFPVALGVGITGIIAFVILIVSGIIEKHSLDLERPIPNTGGLLIAFFFLTPGRKWWKSLVLDGTMILYFLIVWLQT